MPEFDCNNCGHILLTENQQNQDKKRCGYHICGLYDKIILHRNRHPKLTPCKECNGNDFKESEVPHD
jgi:hypothetical protein